MREPLAGQGFAGGDQPSPVGPRSVDFAPTPAQLLAGQAADRGNHVVASLAAVVRFYFSEVEETPLDGHAAAVFSTVTACTTRGPYGRRSVPRRILSFSALLARR